MLSVICPYRYVRTSPWGAAWLPGSDYEHMFAVW